MSIRCLICEKDHAGYRYACHRCETGLQRKLRHLDVYSTWLITPQPYRGGDAGRRSPGYGSRSPARDDVIAAMDIRSDGEMHGPDDVPTPIISIPGGVRYLATWATQRDDSHDTVPKTITGSIAYLLGRVPHIALTRDVAWFADRVTILHNQARALAHDQPPPPLGKCLVVTCEGEVLTRHDYRGRPDGGRCATCLRAYTGLGLVRLAVANDVREQHA